MGDEFPSQDQPGAPPPSRLNDQQLAIREALAGDALTAKGDFAGGRLRYLEAIRLYPDEGQFHWLLGNCQWKLGCYDLAGAHLQTAVRLNPNLAHAQTLLGQWYLWYGMVEQAMQATAKAIEMAPHDESIVESRAWVLEAAGEVNAAWELVQRLIARGRLAPTLAKLYGRLASRYNHQQQALAYAARLLGDPNCPPQKAAILCLTAANLLDQLGRYDEAFALAARGNAMRPSTFQPSGMRRDFDRFIAYFTPQRLACLSKATYGSDKPVFIVGMPRSGTSLVEQILASHPSVHGAGELDFMHRVFHGTLGMLCAQEEDFPGCLDRLSVDHANGMAQIYLMPLIALRPQAARIIDKMYLNFAHLGLISLLLPDAKIIHCRRNPLDTCLSCYLTDFTAANDFTYNLTHLGLFYREYERLMAHWKTVLDLPILDVDYEVLVADPQRQSRRMVEFLGLPWNEQCTRFHETKRPVTTASVLQVRRPIYNASVQRWRKYEKHLTPLKTALGL